MDNKDGKPEDEDYDAVFQDELDKANGKVELDEPDPEEDTDGDEDLDDSESDDADEKDGHPEPTDDPKDGDWEKRYKDLQSFAEKQFNAVNIEKDALALRLEKLEAKLNGDGDEEPSEKPTAKEEFDTNSFIKSIPEDKRQLFEENPELIEVTRDLVKSIVGERKEDQGLSEDAVKEMVAKALAEKEEQINSKQAKAEEEEEWKSVVEKMPEAEEIYNSKLFASWYKNHAEFAEELAATENDRVNGALKVLKYYQNSIALDESSKAKRTSARKSTAGSPKSRSSAPDVGPAEDDYEGAFEFYAKQASKN